MVVGASQGVTLEPNAQDMNSTLPPGTHSPITGFTMGNTKAKNVPSSGFCVTRGVGESFGVTLTVTQNQRGGVPERGSEGGFGGCFTPYLRNSPLG